MTDRLLRLMIMRHAKSSWESSTDRDIDRPLAPRGERDCEVMGQLMSTLDPGPQQVLCSNAKRTRQTWQRLKPYVDKSNGGLAPQVLFSDELYGASLTTWLRHVTDQQDETQSVLVIGHNPELQSLLIYLAGDQVSAGMNGKILPTATLCVLDIASSWKHIREDCATLINIYRPREVPSDIT